MSLKCWADFRPFWSSLPCAAVAMEREMKVWVLFSFFHICNECFFSVGSRLWAAGRSKSSSKWPAGTSPALHGRPGFLMRRHGPRKIFFCFFPRISWEPGAFAFSPSHFTVALQTEKRRLPAADRPAWLLGCLCSVANRSRSRWPRSARPAI